MAIQAVRNRLRVLLLVAAAHGCGSGSTPTAPATLVSVAITGSATPNLNTTSQLTALATLNSGAIQIVTSTAVWQSSNASVATVSSSGLVTAVTAGTSTITVTYQGQSGTLVVVVRASAFSIASCQAISAPGQYKLTADLNNSQTSNSCLSITAANVSLDCGGHTITSAVVGSAAIAMSSTSGFSVSKCTFSTVAGAEGVNANGVQGLSVNNCTFSGGGSRTTNGMADVASSQNVSITNSTISLDGAGSGILSDSVQNLTISNDTVTASSQGIDLRNTKQAQVLNNRVSSGGLPYLQEGGSSSVTVSGNTFTCDGSAFCAAPVYLAGGGNHNTFIQNAMNGGWNGVLTAPTYGKQGADDGIVLDDEDSDVIQGNTISNVFDAGIESVGIFTNAMIENNTITNVGFAGIGSYWGTDWIGNAVQGNHVSGSPYFAVFHYDGNLPGAGDGSPPVTTIGFQNNSFVGNTFQVQTTIPGGFVPPVSVEITFGAYTPLPYPFSGGNNVFTNNSFVSCLSVYPSTLATDGGGNMCQGALGIWSLGGVGSVRHVAPPARRGPMPKAPPHLVLREVIRR